MEESTEKARTSDEIMIEANKEWEEFMKGEYEAVTRVLEWMLKQPSEPVKLCSHPRQSK